MLHTTSSFTTTASLEVQKCWRITVIRYHGSNMVVSEPKPIQQKRFMDFAFGFYTTKTKFGNGIL